MTPEFHQRVRDLFDEALDRPQAERIPFLQTACATDPELLEAVLDLLDAHSESDSFLDERPSGAQRIGRYLVQRELGRGGMGIVYQALDPLIGRTVAVKVIQMNSLGAPGDAEVLRKRLLSEAQTAGLLTHPGILVIHDVGFEGEIAFIAMECLEGPSLQTVLEQNHKLAAPVALDILRQAAAALDYAHRSGVMHRDIKPANIMLHKGTIVKITDFGLAKMTAGVELTSTHMLMGTPAYISPERIRRQPLDGRSDQFSLAVIAFQMLTGSKPFQSDSVPELLHEIIYEQRPAARAVDPTLPMAVNPVFKRGLAVRPEERYATCAEFVAALDEALRAAPATLPELPGPELPKPPIPQAEPARGQGVYFAGAALIVTLLAAFLIYQDRLIPKHAAREIAAPPAPTGTAPFVNRFIGNPGSVESGESAKLLWDVFGSTDVTIDPEVGRVEANGTAEVKPGKPTEYVLTAVGPGGRASARTYIDVKSKPGVIAALPKTAPSIPSIFQPTAPPVKTPTLPLVTPTPPLATPTPPLATPTPLPASLPATPPAARPTPPPKPEPAPRQLFEEAKAAQEARQFSKALELFRQAAERGELSAMVELGDMFRAGQGTAADPHEAARWFRKAAEAGYPIAMVRLGSMYVEGKAMAKDLTEAVRWFRKAADANNAVGMDVLGLMYAGGLGVGRDDHEAVTWYRKASDAGSSSGSYHLASCYERGAGVAKDLIEAVRLYKKAATAGSKDAQKRLTELKRAAGSTPSGPVTVNVPANRVWTDTGISLSAGDTVTVTALGTVSPPASQHIPAMTPSGSAVTCSAGINIYGSASTSSPAPQLPCWSLIGRIGSGDPIAIGGSASFHAKTAGAFYLGINQTNVRDNSGSWKAVVTVQTGAR